MKIQEWELTQIKPYENNPRKNDAAVDKVAASIQEFGFKVPIIVDRNGVIVAGHTRLKAAEKLGLKTAPVIVAEDLNDEQVKAFRLADNKTAEFAEWDIESLESELADISDIDMDQFGFDMDAFREDGAAEIIEDEIPENVETKCKLGDLWKLGNHRLICGDSTDATVIDRLMDGVKADMVFTDSP
jgi:site-specific DNA-methyltransferase (adenine-specific)